jgi:tetratricopeptide (TPR) repeat protein
MPATTYMDVDSRRDHSFRIPHPGLSVELGTPNACTGCHVKDAKIPKDQWPQPLTSSRGLEYADWLREARAGNAEIRAELGKIDRWADRWIKEWFPSAKREPHFAAALSAARNQSADAQQRLIELLRDHAQPAVARATAATELGAYVHSEMQADDPAIACLVEALRDRDPQVRAAAIGSLQGARNELLAETLPPLLKDPMRLVRTRAAFALSALPTDEVLRRDQPVWFKKALEELLQGAEFDNDRAGGHLLRGTVLENQGRLSEALDEYETAMRLEPANAATRSSAARLLDYFVSQEQAALQQAARFGDASGAQRHAQAASELGTRFAQLKAEEWSFLERDAEMVADNAALQLQVGLARHHQGYEREAAYSFAAAHWLAPRNPLFGYYLAIYYSDAGRIDEARELAERLVELRPNHPDYERLLRELGETEAAANR